jgi:hypothetical protein
MDKFDIAWAIEFQLGKTDPEMVEEFKWLLQVWNTDNNPEYPSLVDDSECQDCGDARGDGHSDCPAWTDGPATATGGKNWL